MKSLELCEHRTILSVIREQAARHGDHPALIGETERFSYRELVDRADRYGAWAVARSIDVGELIGLLMPNCPDYAAIWLGASEVGCAVALLNTGLAGDALAHAILVSGSRHIIVAPSLLARLAAVTTQLPGGTRIWVHGGDAPAGMEAVILPAAGTPADARERAPARSDRALLIGTSGTTGMPKSANTSHARVLEWSSWFGGMMDVRPQDRLYDCLPMYHSIGGVVAVGAMLSRGGSVLIRERFSASAFWNDIVEGDCTIFQYIGELCRYLAKAPAHALERAHRLRLCCGNGLRHDVWRQFQQRFAIPRIIEFYAATEGHVSLYNLEGEEGAIGRIPPFLRQRLRVELIRSDGASGQPLRDAAGLCIRCAADEPGEAVAPARSPVSPHARPFDGYTDVQESERKLLHDVFVRGDLWYRTGDLMRRDGRGFYYFVDRIGDSYRWKGENVSTMEVAATIAGCPGVSQAAVFGVAIPGRDGRAGLAAITCDHSFSFPVLVEHLSKHLAEPSRPLFVRTCPTLAATGTFRPVKGALIEAGLSLRPELGTLWFHDRALGGFTPCDEALLGRILDGSQRL